MHYDYEYLFINDGSADKTLQIIRHLHAIDPKRIHYISFARNFGKESAMAAGFNNIPVTTLPKWTLIYRIHRLYYRKC